MQKYIKENNVIEDHLILRKDILNKLGKNDSIFNNETKGQNNSKLSNNDSKDIVNKIDVKKKRAKKYIKWIINNKN